MCSPRTRLLPFSRPGVPPRRALEERADADGVLVTGSFAAVRRAPVAAPALLCLYCRDPAAIAQGLGLLPADPGAGGNVVLLQPFDEVVWERADRDGEAAYAAISQVAVDCLTGNGRMPAEGEAVLGWMGEHEDEWRAGRLPTKSDPE